MNMMIEAQPGRPYTNFTLQVHSLEAMEARDDSELVNLMIGFFTTVVCGYFHVERPIALPPATGDEK